METARQCKRCGHVWYASQPWVTGRPIIGTGFTAQQQAANLLATRMERKQRVDSWEKCPACGSKKIGSLRMRPLKAQKLVRQQNNPQPLAAAPTQSPVSIPAGWYRDPLNVAHWRWWDGNNWTETVG